LQYAEAGAMRILHTHPLTLALVDKFGLQRRLFYNVDVDPESGPDSGRAPGTPPPVTYRSSTGEVWRNRPQPSAPPAFTTPEQAGRTWIRVNGIQVRRRDYLRDPSAVNVSFDTNAVGHTASDLFDKALQPVDDYYSTMTPTGRVDLPTPARIEDGSSTTWTCGAREVGRCREVRFCACHRLGPGR
jgi:monoamine oxidase